MFNLFFLTSNRKNNSLPNMKPNCMGIKMLATPAATSTHCTFVDAWYCAEIEDNKSQQQ